MFLTVGSRYNGHLQGTFFTVVYEIPNFRTWWGKQVNRTRIWERMQYNNVTSASIWDKANPKDMNVVSTALLQLVQDFPRY
jgi:hypothetical protein